MTDVSNKATKAKFCPRFEVGLENAIAKPLIGLLFRRFGLMLLSFFRQQSPKNDIDSLNEHMLSDIGLSGIRSRRNRFRSAAQANLPRHLLQ